MPASLAPDPSPLTPTLEIRTLPAADLRPAPYNPRRPLAPSSPAYRKLRASLEAFGLVEPLVWNARTGHVVGGHARLAILRDLGVTEVPVAVVDLDDAREKALNVVLNNRDAQGKYDPDKLADILTELADLPELPLTGFTAADLANLRLAPVGLEPEPPTDGRIEVVLGLSAERFGEYGPTLDGWARADGVEVHVRRG